MENDTLSLSKYTEKYAPEDACWTWRDAIEGAFDVDGVTCWVAS